MPDFRCMDYNNQPLNIGSPVMCMDGYGHELEGTVVELLPDNNVLIEPGEGGNPVRKNAKDCYILP